MRRAPILMAVALAAGCGDGPTAPSVVDLPRSLTAGEQQLVAANNRFAFSLFREIARQASADSNLFVSPVSVSMALGMAVNGAQGATRDSMLRALELGGVPIDEVNRGYRGVIDLLRGLDPGVEFTLANSVWAKAGYAFGEPFLNDARTWFDATVRVLDFASPTAAQTINDWVSTQTRGKIPEIVGDAIPPDVIMYLINAIYFKGSWSQRFDPALTRDAPFDQRAGGSVTARMMTHASPAPVRYAVDGGTTIVDLPYGGRAWSMTIVLPPTAAGIDSLVAGLSEERWNGWMAALDTTRVLVTMPKFTLRYELEMKPVLSALGMGIAFAGGADFTRLLPSGGAYISDVIHKTFLDVYEEGSEAAAVTAVVFGDAASAGPPHVVVDRPFLVAIRERLTGTVLFLGRVTNPAAS